MVKVIASLLSLMASPVSTHTQHSHGISCLAGTLKGDTWTAAATQTCTGRDQLCLRQEALAGTTTQGCDTENACAAIIDRDECCTLPAGNLPMACYTESMTEALSEQLSNTVCVRRCELNLNRPKSTAVTAGAAQMGAQPLSAVAAATLLGASAAAAAGRR